MGLIDKEATLKAIADYLRADLADCNHHYLQGAQDVAEVVENMPEVGGWIPCSERLPEKSEEEGMSNWHTDTVLACVYGINIHDTLYSDHDVDCEILTGRFVMVSEAESEKEVLVFEPDRITLFIPEEWDFIELDEGFKCHFDEKDCWFINKDDLSVFRDRYYHVIAWQPLPEPYKEADNGQSRTPEAGET